MPTFAQRALTDEVLRDSAVEIQFFTRCTVYTFSDDSRLVVNVSGLVYAE